MTVRTFKGVWPLLALPSAMHTEHFWAGSTLIDIREFYGDDNDLKPGKKGISLSQEQVCSLMTSCSVQEA